MGHGGSIITQVHCSQWGYTQSTRTLNKNGKSFDWSFYDETKLMFAIYGFVVLSQIPKLLEIEFHFRTKKIEKT